MVLLLYERHCGRARLASTRPSWPSVSKRSAGALARPWSRWRRTWMDEDRCGAICEGVETSNERAAALDYSCAQVSGTRQPLLVERFGYGSPHAES